MKERGFTLIELLVVVAIIGVLAAIAIPVFSSYKINAWNANALAILKQSVTAQEAVYVDTGNYVSCVSPFDCELNLPSLRVSASGGTYLVNPIRHDAAVDGQSYTAFASHINGNKTFTYNSVTGAFADN